MKTYPRIARRRPVHRRVPAFVPVPLRVRGDGWSPARQAAFLGALAETRSVSAAARRVNMARETAYRLRRRAGAQSFAAAWDAVMGRGMAARRKVTAEELVQRAYMGLLKPMLYGGKHVATVRKADNSALLRLLGQIDRAQVAGIGGAGRSQGFAARPASTPEGAFAAKMRRFDTPAPRRGWGERCN